MTGFEKASWEELSRMDHLVYTRQLTPEDLNDVEKWVTGYYGNLSASYMIDWLKGKDFREDLPSGVVFP